MRKQPRQAATTSAPVASAATSTKAPSAASVPVKPAAPAPGRAPILPSQHVRVPSTLREPAQPASPSSSPAPVSEIARRAREGLVPFLVASAPGGSSLSMPCVWPMIPVTVNFFVKQGQQGKGKGSTVGLAITYCLAIIAIFTAVGVLFSFFFSASFLQNLANNSWLNLAVAAIFVAFGLSLLGLFEFRLPSFLLNASAQGESRGGLIGVMFMALTLTITSFTCTFPVVGGLLFMAAGGNFLYPVIGLATFATVLAVPFFLLALSPSLIARMPRSGDWMNSVKVVGGLVEIGAAFKFLNTAELGYVTPDNAWFDAHVVLTAWIVLSAVCGFYLLGFFRTDHDQNEVRVGPGRMIFGSLFLGLALYMAPALFGRPPQSLVWDRLIAAILPPDAVEFGRPLQVAGATTAAAERCRGCGGDQGHLDRSGARPAPGEEGSRRRWGMKLRSGPRAGCRPEEADPHRFHRRQLRQLPAHGVAVLPKPQVVSLLRQFVTVQLYTDYVPIASLTAVDRKALPRRTAAPARPCSGGDQSLLCGALAQGKVVSSMGGYNEPTALGFPE